VTQSSAVVAVAALTATLSAGASQRQQPTFRAATTGVSVDVSVRDGNQPVSGLGAADFIVYDGETRQTITSVSMGAVPVDATIFLGTNNQTSARQIESLNADMRRIAALLHPEDRVRLLTLENQVTDVFGWRAVAGSEAAMHVQIGGIQSLYDACFLAMMHRPDPDRRHLIVAVTDGVEFGSVVDSVTVRDVARRAEAVLHLVFVDPITPPGPGSAPTAPAGQPLANLGNPIPDARQPAGFLFLRATWFHVMPDEHGLERLQEAARLTGGTVRHGSSAETLVESFRKALDDFRRSYLLRYTAEGVPLGGWHDLRVEMANGKKYTIRARKSYFGG
jgi:VWFA-related protein